MFGARNLFQFYYSYCCLTIIILIIGGSGSSSSGKNLRTNHVVSAAVPTEQNPTECVTNFDPSVDYFPQKVSSSNSVHWNVSYHKHYKIVTNEFRSETYLLVQCGTPMPSSSENLNDFDVVTYIPPPDGVAVTTTTIIPFIELLGLRHELKSYITDPQYISSPCLLELIQQGQVETSANNNNEHLSTVQDFVDSLKNPQRLIFDGSYEITPSNQTVSISASKEGRNADIFEWIEFYSTFFNKEATAQQIVMDTTQRADCVSANANAAATSNKANNKPPPTVIWGSYSNYPGYEGWNLAKPCIDDGGSGQFNYYCEYAQVCNVTLLTESNSLSHDNFFNLAKDADVFFYVSHLPTFEELYETEKEWMDNMKSVKTKQVYDYLKSGQGAWFEQRLAEYDVVTQDFCTVVNSTLPSNNYRSIPSTTGERRWFRNVLQNETIGNLPPCQDTSAPLVTQLSSTPCSELQGSGEGGTSNKGEEESSDLFGSTGSGGGAEIAASSDLSSASSFASSQPVLHMMFVVISALLAVLP